MKEKQGNPEFKTKGNLGLDTDNLITFKIVAEKGSMAAAARELGLTANAVALRLRALEEEFGKALVARAGRVVRPTAAGHAVLQQLPGFLADLRNLRTAALGSEIAGELRIGAIATALTGLLPSILEASTKLYPHLRLHLVPGTSAELFTMATEGGIDAAAIVAPEFDLPKMLEFSLWRRETFVLMVPADELRTSVFDILAASPLILYDREQWGGRLAAQWIENTGIAADIRFELDALDAIAVLVGRGLGVSVVPDWAGPRPEGSRVRVLPLPTAIPSRGIGLLYQRNAPRTHLAEVLDQVAGTVLKEQMLA
ncbi:LysR family transcriptional regulator [Vannielia litorea]|uniref:LysR family transcriptional regulator n=1 Tax=Vannielia litorea TaxID=1217970 RepID=UPI001C93816B|nr:LysR family transcriptional regulator [Vannielia litorea]MBY6153810.1 LysR family transcriptional regulator [Vannielia litorea]